MRRYLRTLAAPCTGGAVFALGWIVLAPMVFGLQRSVGFGVVLGLVFAAAWSVAQHLHPDRRRAGGARRAEPDA